jgi:hypothetical protein
VKKKPRPITQGPIVGRVRRTDGTLTEGFPSWEVPIEQIDPAICEGYAKAGQGIADKEDAKFLADLMATFSGG